MRNIVLRLSRTPRRFASDASGATAIEYTLLAVIIGVGIVGGLELLADGSDSIWSDYILTEIDAAINGGG